MQRLRIKTSALIAYMYNDRIFRICDLHNGICDLYMFNLEIAASSVQIAPAVRSSLSDYLFQVILVHTEFEDCRLAGTPTETTTSSGRSTNCWTI